MSTQVSRTGNFARNAGVSVLAQILVALLGFVSRSVFIAELGVALLGVNALLANLLAFLAFADLGINGAVMYALFKPLQDGEVDKVRAIVQYATRLYRWVALAVAGLGLAATPFIHLFVNLDEDVPGLEIYYLVLLVNTVLGYLMQARLILLNADQKIYVAQGYSLVSNTLRSLTQILVLLVWSNFLVFLAIQVIFTVTNSLAVYLRAGQLYPFVKASSQSLGRADRRLILTSVRAMAIFRIGGLILNSSTAVLVSMVVGTAALGYYSNYMLIVSSVAVVSEVVFASLTPSVGNLVATGDRLAVRRVFDEVTLLSVIIYGWFAVGLITLVDDLIVVWLGPEFVLPPLVVFGIALNTYVAGTLTPMWSFRSATGLFRQSHFVVLITAVVSVVLALALGDVFGLAGIVIAPALARLLTGGWYEPFLLLRYHLTGGVFRYFRFQVGVFALWVILALANVWLSTVLPSGTVESILVKAAVCVGFLGAGSWVAFRHVGAFQTLMQRVRTLVQGGRRQASGDA